MMADRSAVSMVGMKVEYLAVCLAEQKVENSGNRWVEPLAASLVVHLVYLMAVQMADH